MHLFNTTSILGAPNDEREGSSHSHARANINLKNSEGEGFSHSHEHITDDTRRVEREGFSHSHISKHDDSDGREGFPYSHEHIRDDSRRDEREGFSHSRAHTSKHDDSDGGEGFPHSHAHTDQRKPRPSTITTDINHDVITQNNSSMKRVERQRSQSQYHNKHNGDVSQWKTLMTRAHRPQVLFTLPAEKPPTCEILTATDDLSINKWRIQHHEYIRALSRYNDRYGIRHTPPLQDCVSVDTWRIISTDLLNLEDATDACAGDPNNDSAVTDFLLQRNNYAPDTNVKVGELCYANSHDDFKALKWPQMKRGTHTARFDLFLTSWYHLSRTVAHIDMPKDKALVNIMLSAIRPDILRRGIALQMQMGRSPEPYSRDTTPWRKATRKNLRWFRRLVREHTQCLDREIRTRDVTFDKTTYFSYYTRYGVSSLEPIASDVTTSEAIGRGGEGSTRPTCVISGCTNLVNRKRRGSGYYLTCKAHARGPAH